MEIEGSPLVVGLCPVLAITQEFSRNPIAFLERGLQKFANLDLGSYKGQVILKDKFLSQCASDIRIELQQLQQLQQQDRASSLEEMVQTATNTFYNRKGEGDQGPGKGEKQRDKACPDSGLFPGNPCGKPRVLEGQGTRQMPNL